MKLLIANRGEIAVRIARAAADLGIESVAVHSTDDDRSRHALGATTAVSLGRAGPAAYLDAERILAVARDTGCTAVHPGYGFLSEDADFAERCAAADLVFVGPPPAVLRQLGDKVQARALAGSLGIPVVDGTGPLADAAAARAFVDELDGAPVVLKAVAGGGGRGMSVIERAEDTEAAFARSRSEAERAFGRGDLFAERYLPSVRHVEVQIVGDGTDVIHLGERECSIQRRHQKLIELAPAPQLDPSVRTALLDAAVALGRACAYASLGTIELLVDRSTGAHHFLEANPRLQVEHTVTEAVTGIDLVQIQLRLAAGTTLASLALDGTPRGRAIQLRVNAETMDATGTVHPAGGVLDAFEPPTGPGVRVDTFGYAGYATNPSFDPLLAKVIIHAPTGELDGLLGKADRALAEFRIAGTETNLGLLRAVLERPELAAWDVDTAFVDAHAAELVEAAGAIAPHALGALPAVAPPSAPTPGHLDGPAGTTAVPAPLRAAVVSVAVTTGDTVVAGQEIAVLEALKMQHVVVATRGGIVRAVVVAPDEVVDKGQPVVFVEETGDDAGVTTVGAAVDLDLIRDDLRAVRERVAISLDENRPEAVEKRHSRGLRTARENVADLCDDGSFREYGQLTVAAQRRVRSLDDLMARTPADGIITGVGAVNGDRFDAEHSQTAVLAYDYTVLAGTQGLFSHKKTDRLLELAHQWRLPVIFFTEGGGGRPGDTDSGASMSSLDIATFATFAATSGSAPRIAVNSGACFAGNAVLFGCADVTIATRTSSIGMAGPVMIEAGGLGSYRTEEVGPIDVQAANGVVDVVVEDEIEGVAVAKQVLSYFQGSVADWECADQRHLRHVIPENRKRVYDMRAAIDLLADTGSVMELRRHYGIGIITAFVRIEGRPFGLYANDPMHLGGAIDAEGAEKAARFMQLCDAFDIPLISLCDTPGFMVGPDAEKEATVRRASRMMVVGANLTVPVFMVCLRKGYGLGAQGMGGGSFHSPFFNISWPTGEFGPMGLEGAVRFAFRKQLEEMTDEHERAAFFDARVADIYAAGQALSVARFLEIDAVIDPADTRSWIVGGADAARAERAKTPKKRPFVDTW